MISFHHVMIIIAAVTLVGCGPSERMVAYQSAPTASAIEGSIFSSDLKSAGNADVALVLDGQIPMKEHGGLAVLPIGNMYFMDAGYAEAVNHSIAGQVATNRFIGSITKVPRMLMPTQVTVSNIREMGARLQCENVLVYTAYQDYRYDSKLFAKDELRIGLTVEAVLVNVRTGCIPVAVSSDQSTVIKESDKDFDRYEFTRRAQRECLLAGIQQTCEKVNGVLSAVR